MFLADVVPQDQWCLAYQVKGSCGISLAVLPPPNFNQPLANQELVSVTVVSLGLNLYFTGDVVRFTF